MKKVLILLACALSVTAAPFKSCCCQDDFECAPDLFKRFHQTFSGSAEFLYWSVAEGALDYALKMRQNAWGPTPSFAQGHFQTATYGLDPGFRLGFLFFRAPNYWEVRWQYTRMTSRGENHASKPGPSEQFLTGTFPQIMTNPLTGAHSHLHLNYNVFDWLVDRVFIPNPHLKLRVLGGAIVAWLNQDWKVVYNDSTPAFTTVRNRWNFTGAGLKTGVWTDWYWTWDLYLTAQAFFGVLMGSYTNRAEENTTFQTTAADNPRVPVRKARYEDARPVLTGQMLFGPSYQKNLPHNRIEFFIGAEFNAWFNLQEIYRSTQAAASAAKETWMSTGLLSLYGLTTRLTLDF